MESVAYSVCLLSIFKPITFGVITALVATAVLLICSALVSGSEIAFFSLSPANLEELENRKSRRSAKVLQLLKMPKKLLATILIANNFINVGIVIVSTYIMNGLLNFDPLATYRLFWLDIFEVSALIMAMIVQVGVVTFIILLLGEVIPKVYATKHGLSLALLMAYPIAGLSTFFTPISKLLVASTSIIDKRIKRKGGNISVDELSHALELTDDESTHTEEQKILEGIVKFGNTDVKQIMTARLDVIALKESTGYQIAVQQIVDSGYSRIPVYKDDLDTITGILYIKDLLPYIDHENVNWVKLIRQPFFVPENKKIDDLLREFQEKKVHLAVVVDEYGGTSGIVSLEDILEEIVGDIADEFDDEELVYSKLDDDNFVFEGKIALNDIYRVLGIDGELFEEVKGEADTLAGFIIEQAGKIPKKNEKIKFDRYLFTIEAADKRRVKQIKLTIKPEEDSNKENGSGKVVATIALLLLLFAGCEEENYIPKPAGYMRVDVPDKNYTLVNDECPYYFEIPQYATVESNEKDSSTYCFKTINFPQFNAMVSITYKNLDGSIGLSEYSAHSREKAYEHDIKARSIDESSYYNDTTRVFARMFNIEGDVAKNTVFYCTDSLNHFMHGELMFWATPNYDSLQPILEFIRADIEHFIKTLKWETDIALEP